MTLNPSDVGDDGLHGRAPRYRPVLSDVKRDVRRLREVANQRLEGLRSPKDRNVSGCLTGCYQRYEGENSNPERACNDCQGITNDWKPGEEQ